MRKIKKILIFSAIFMGVFLLARASEAASPILFYSSAKAGSNVGWEQSTTKGNAITVWAKNSGASRGANYVTVAGVNLTSDSDYAEWGATTNPTTAK